MGATGDAGDHRKAAGLARAGVRSYVRTAPVYMGCMH